MNDTKKDNPRPVDESQAPGPYRWGTHHTGDSTRTWCTLHLWMLDEHVDVKVAPVQDEDKSPGHIPNDYRVRLSGSDHARSRPTGHA